MKPLFDAWLIQIEITNVCRLACAHFTRGVPHVAQPSFFFPILALLALCQARQVEAQVLTPTGSMGASRGYMTFTRLNDGRVLAAGGGVPEVRTAEIYNPATGAWTPTGSMTDARGQGPGAVLLKNGKVLVMAGHGEGLPSSELYDPATGQWTPTGFLVNARYWTAAVSLKDGRVLMFGGYTASGVSASAEIYDPVSGLWSNTESMNRARYVTQKGVLLKDGRVLVAGGHGAGSLAEVFDPAIGRWDPSGTIPFGVNDLTLTLLADGRVLATGNSTPNFSSEAKSSLFDPLSGTWSPAAPLPAAVDGGSATLLLNGKALLVGPGGSWIYDTTSQTWTAVPGAPGVASGNQAARLLDGRVLAAGGTAGSRSAFIFTGSPDSTIPVLTMSVSAPASPFCQYQ